MPMTRAWCGAEFRERFAAVANRAGIGREDAGDDVDQRRLAGAVLAEEGVHLAGVQIEVDMIEREHAGKPLRDPRHLEQGSRPARVVGGPFGRAASAGPSAHAGRYGALTE